MDTPPIDTAVIGIQRGLDTIQNSAAKLATAGQLEGGEDQTVTALTELEQGKQQAQASAKALSAENDVIGALLSVRA